MGNDLPAYVSYLTFLIALLGTFVILWGVIASFIGFIHLEFSRIRGEDVYRNIALLRYHLGHHLLLGLEFLIAADIVATILRPTLEEVAVLGSIVVIRTILSYFLNKELKVRQQPRGEGDRREDGAG